MNDYDFGKYYRNKNKKTTPASTFSNFKFDAVYRKISIGVAFGLVLFFAGLMTGIHYQENRIVNKNETVALEAQNSETVESADIAPQKITSGSDKIISSLSQNDSQDSPVSPVENKIKETLIDPQNEYIILARRYNEESKDRALYYAGVLNKLVKDQNFKVIPSIRGKTIKIYVGPMKGRRNAEKMLVRIKSIPEFTNSAILYEK